MIYSFSARPEITRNGVQYILDTVIEALVDNPDRRYIYVEMAFFWRWWNQQSETTQSIVKQLVNESLYRVFFFCFLKEILFSVSDKVVWNLFLVVGV